MVRSKRDRAAPGPVLGSVYLWAVALISIAVLAILASTSHGGPTPLSLAIELVLLGAIAQHFPLPIGPQHKVDTSIAVYFACVLLFDTPAAVVVVGVSQVLGQATLALRRVPGTGKRMRGARGVLFNITANKNLGLHELNAAAQVIADVVDADAEIIFGTAVDPKLGDEVKITVIATGFARPVAVHPIPDEYRRQAPDDAVGQPAEEYAPPLRLDAAANAMDTELPTFLRRTVAAR